jgi:hypothetical protein
MSTPSSRPETAEPTPAPREWTAPTLVRHETLGALTQSALPGHFNLLFLQASMTQCFGPTGQPRRCP